MAVDVDHISRLPDGVLGDIVSLLPTKDGARTQLLSSRWRPIWRSAPLNFDGDATHSSNTACTISRILSAHEGPGRRFCPRLDSLDLGRRRSSVLDGWLQCPALDGLQELELHFGNRFAIASGWSSLPSPLLPPLPASVHRFSSTLRVASFSGCSFSPEGGDASPLHLPVLEQLSISHAMISENSLKALLLAGCPVLQSLLLSYNSGCSQLRIVSGSLRSIGVNLGSGDSRLQHLVVEDAPCLERLLLFSSDGEVMDISVISAPNLGIVGPLRDDYSRIKFGSTVFWGPRVSFVTMLPSVKILALVNEHLNLDVAIGFLRCFPCLQKLYIKTTLTGCKNWWFDEHEDLVSTLDIRVKKVVLLNYRGNKSHVNFAKLFVLSARVLESMVLELEKGIELSNEWIERQHKRLHTKNRASSGAQFDFVHHDGGSRLFGYVNEEQAHDMSTADPFLRLHKWSR